MLVLARLQREHSQAQHTQAIDRKSTRLNSSHSQISYAVFCLKKKKETVAFDPSLTVVTFHVTGPTGAASSIRAANADPRVSPPPTPATPHTLVAVVNFGSVS